MRLVLSPAGVGTPDAWIQTSRSRSSPLGGLGEFGMNMMAVSCGETTIVIDAGAMFPGPELLGVDLIVPDLTYLQDTPRRGARADARPRGSHRRRALRLAAASTGPCTARRSRWRSSSPSSKSTRSTPGDRLRPVQPGDRVRVGPIDSRVPARHAQHSRLRGAGAPHAGRHARPHRRLQGRSDAARRPALRPAPVRDAGIGRRAGAVRRQHEHRSAAASPARSSKSSAPSRRSSRRRPGMLVVATFSSSLYRDADARAAGRAVRPQGRVRRPRHDAELGDRACGSATSSVPAGVQIRDSEVPNYPPDAGALHQHRIAGRAAIGAVAHRHRRPPAREDRPPATRSCCLRARFPGNEKAIGRVINHLTRRGAEIVTESNKHVHVSGHGSEEELKLVLSLVRPRYFVPVHGEYRHLAQHQRVAERVTRGSERPVDVRADRKRRHPALRRRRRRQSSARRRPAAC